MPEERASTPRQSEPRTTRADRTIETRTCQGCGMLLDHPAEFHPFMFCILKRAGYEPWEYFAHTYKQLTDESLPERPPLVRDLPLARRGTE